MAYTVSADYLAQINNLLRKPRAYIDFGSGVYAYDNTNLIKFEIAAELQKNSSLFGNTPSKYIKLEIKNPNNNTYSLAEGNTFNAYLGITLDYGLITESIEYVPQGLFTITHITRDSVNNKLIIEGFDNMIKFNIPFTNDLTFPSTVGALVDDLCDKAGVVLDNPTFTGYDIVLTYAPNAADQELTVRDILGDAVEVAGANAIITRDGKLKVVLLTGSSAATFTKNNYFEYESGAATNAFNVIYDEHQPENDTITYPVSVPVPAYPYTMYNNVVAYLNRDTTIDNTYAAINGVSYQGYTLKNRGLYYLDLCDKITITNPAGTTFTSFVLNQNIAYDGSTSESLRADKYAAVEETYVPITTKEAIRQTGITVDKINNEITLMAGDYYDGILNGAKYVFDGTNASFYNGGLTIYNAANTAVFQADVNGDMTLIGDIINKDSNGYNRVVISDDKISFTDQNNVSGGYIYAYNKNIRAITPYAGSAAGEAAFSVDAQDISFWAYNGSNTSNYSVIGLSGRATNGLEVYTGPRDVNFISTNSIKHQTAPNSAYYKMWDENNDGAGSGLDADLLDGVQGANYAQIADVYDDSSTYRQILAKNGSSTGYLRAPSTGFISASAGTGLLGTDTWQWDSIYGEKIYQNLQEVISLAGEETTNPRTVKYSDGTIVKWGTTSVSINTSTAIGNYYRSTALTLTFDTTYPFTVNPVVFINPESTTRYFTTTINSVSTTAATYFVLNPVSAAAASYTVHYLAVGR